MANRASMLIRLIQGPAMMILLGALFLLSRSTEYTFSRTWPALIIALGLLKLLERVVERTGSEATGGNP